MPFPKALSQNQQKRYSNVVSQGRKICNIVINIWNVWNNFKMTIITHHIMSKTPENEKNWWDLNICGLIIYIRLILIYTAVFTVQSILELYGLPSFQFHPLLRKGRSTGTMIWNLRNRKLSGFIRHDSATFIYFLELYFEYSIFNWLSRQGKLIKIFFCIYR